MKVIKRMTHRAAFEQCCFGTFPLRMGNTFLSEYFRSVVGPVQQGKIAQKLPSVSPPLRLVTGFVVRWMGYIYIYIYIYIL